MNGKQGKQKMNAAFLIFFEVLYEEAATGDNLSKKVFLKILQNSQKNTCAVVHCLLIRLPA